MVLWAVHMAEGLRHHLLKNLDGRWRNRMWSAPTPRRITSASESGAPFLPRTTEKAENHKMKKQESGVAFARIEMNIPALIPAPQAPQNPQAPPGTLLPRQRPYSALQAASSVPSRSSRAWSPPRASIWWVSSWGGYPHRPQRRSEGLRRHLGLPLPGVAGGSRCGLPGGPGLHMVGQFMGEGGFQFFFPHGPIPPPAYSAWCAARFPVCR